MTRLNTLTCAAIVLSSTLGAAVAHADSNVAFNKTVTLDGTFGVGGWGGASLGTAASLTDGVYLPEGTEWDHGSVFWNASLPESKSNSIVIDLGGNFSLTRFSMQADNNDTYRIQYDKGGVWQTAADIGAVSGWGLMTRDSGLLPAILTDKLRITAISGDSAYGVSELQAFGVAAPVPEPESYALMLAGLGLVGFAARRRKANAAR